MKINHYLCRFLFFELFFFFFLTGDGLQEGDLGDQIKPYVVKTRTTFCFKGICLHLRKSWKVFQRLSYAFKSFRIWCTRNLDMFFVLFLFHLCSILIWIILVEVLLCLFLFKVIKTIILDDFLFSKGTLNWSEVTVHTSLCLWHYYRRF